MAFPSVALFADRAQAARPDFAVTPRNAPAVAALCRRLEGLPLALELAASWAQVQTPAQMLARLQAPLYLLANRRADVLERHRILSATISWSYDLLSPDLQRFWASLAVFRGGWTEQAAQSVCREPRALEFLAYLQARSLVVAEEVADEIRWRMLEPLREFAWEQASPEAWAAVSARHTAYFLALAEEAAPHLQGADRALWLGRLDAEHDNLRQVMAGSAGPGGDAQVGLRLSAALRLFWLHRGHAREGRTLIERALAAATEDTPARAGALNGLGTLARSQGDFAAAHRTFEECIAVSRRCGRCRHGSAGMDQPGRHGAAAGGLCTRGAVAGKGPGRTPHGRRPGRCSGGAGEPGDCRAAAMRLCWDALLERAEPGSGARGRGPERDRADAVPSGHSGPGPGRLCRRPRLPG